MKFPQVVYDAFDIGSLPARGGWIEIAFEMVGFLDTEGVIFELGFCIIRAEFLCSNYSLLGQEVYHEIHKKQRLDTGCRIYDGEITKNQAAEQYDVVYQTARDYMRLDCNENHLSSKWGWPVHR